MKMPRPALFVVALCSAATVFAAPIESKVTAVTVYSDRAVVTRTGSADLAAGSTELVFANLPESLMDQSLQFKGSGSAAVTILDVTARRTFLEHAADERVKAAQAEVDALARQMRAIEDQTRLLDARKAMIERMEIALTTPGNKDVARPMVEELAQALNFVTEQRAKLASDFARLEEQRTELERKHQAAQAQLQELHGPGKRAVKSITVRLSVAEAGTLNATLAYAVPHARWAPTYDARVVSGDRNIVLGYFGVVRQTTGEDWKDVALTLSTARPALGGAAPTLQPWEIQEFRPIPMATAAGASDRIHLQAFELGAVAKSRPLSFGASAQPPTERKAELATAEVETGTTSASFRIATAVTIPSDGSSQKVPITTAQLAAQPEYLTVPKKQATAFLTSKVTNSSEFPLLAGAMNVFLDGTFVATSNLRTVMPGEQFDLALGADEGIAVKHKRVQKFVEQTGLTNSGVRYTYEYLITVQNNKAMPVRLVVHDQVPLARHEKIVVKQLVPGERELKADNEGLLKWTLDLKPGEKRDLTVKFSVEHPNDLNVSGIE